MLLVPDVLEIPMRGYSLVYLDDDSGFYTGYSSFNVSVAAIQGGIRLKYIVLIVT